MFQEKSKRPKLSGVPIRPHQKMDVDLSKFRLSEHARPLNPAMKSAPAVLQRDRVAAAAVEDVAEAVHPAKKVALVMIQLHPDQVWEVFINGAGNISANQVTGWTHCIHVSLTRNETNMCGSVK
jgi:hypothetical protein